MGYKPIPTRKLIAWLKSIGIVHKRTAGSHHIFDHEDDDQCLPRPLVIRSNDKDIPPLHIKTLLLTLGIPYTDFEKQIKNY